jgi:hypothetical protein
MDSTDLRSIWQDAHRKKPGDFYDLQTIEKTIKMNHSKAFSKVLTGIKWKIVAYATGTITISGMMFYALIYLNLKLSAYSLTSLVFAGLFILIKTILEIRNLFLLKNTTDSMTLKESLQAFRMTIKRMKVIDFLTFLVYFYLFALDLVINYLHDMGAGENKFWGNPILLFILFLIIIFLVFPWILKYFQNQEYKKIISEMNYSINLLIDEVPDCKIH